MRVTDVNNNKKKACNSVDDLSLDWDLDPLTRKDWINCVGIKIKLYSVAQKGLPWKQIWSGLITVMDMMINSPANAPGLGL